MKGASRVKTVILVVIMGMVVILGIMGMDTVKTYMSGAAGDYQPSDVTANVEADGKSAMISWKTTKESRGYVEYGTTPASLLLRSEIDSSEGSLTHRVNLSSLKVNINYYYRIRVGEDEAKKSEWEVFDNAGIPYSFNTKVAGGVPTVTVAPVPTVFLSPAVPQISVTPASGNPPASCQGGVDYNQDGITNSLDMIVCLKGGAVGTPPVKVSPTIGTKIPTPTGPVKPTSKCPGGVDLDGNGIANSLDVIKCLQGR